MPRSSRLIEVAWDVLETLLREWQRQPFFCDREIDVQAALAARRSAAFSLLGKGTVTGVYEGAPPGYRQLQQYSRVACEPPLSLPRPYAPLAKCLPDIVIWKDVEDPMRPPHPYSWPLLWACELKYGAGKLTDWDESKMKALLAAGSVDEACVVHLNRTIAASGSGLTCRQQDGVRVYIVELPKVQSS